MHGRAWAVVAPWLFLVCAGCQSTERDGTEREETRPSDAGAGGDAGGDAGNAGRGGFHAVESAQPTESGAWVVDPREPLTLYALGQRSLRSRDGGHTWSELGWPAGATALLFATRSAPALYLRVSRGLSSESALFKSSDDGQSWAEIVTLAGGNLELVDDASGPVLLSIGDDHITRSTDDGATWVAAELSPQPDIPFQLGRALVSTGAEPVVYVEAVRYDADFGPTVLISKDAGASFVATALPAVGTFATDAPRLSLDCEGRLYVLADHTVYRSSDVGASWAVLIGPEPDLFTFEALAGARTACGAAVHAAVQQQSGSSVWRFDESGELAEQKLPESGLVLDLGADRLLLVSLFDLRQRSDDGGRTWWTAGIDLGIGEVVSSPARTGLLFASTVTGIYRSDDGGRRWQLGTQYPGRYMSDLYPDPHDGEVVYARSNSGENSPWTFVSRDGGATFDDWPVPSAAAPEIPLAIATSATGAVTVATHGGVYITRDAGRHFSTLLTSELGIVQAAIGGRGSSAIFVALPASESTHELRSSTDGGATWVSADPGGNVWSLVVHPADPSVAFARVANLESEGWLRTFDGGKSWSRIAAPGREPPSTLYIDPSPPYAVYGLTHSWWLTEGLVGSLYRSDDRGDAWQELAALPPLTRGLDIAAQPSGARRVLGETGALYELFE